jgi:hypothetical protein
MPWIPVQPRPAKVEYARPLRSEILSVWIDETI